MADSPGIQRAMALDLHGKTVHDAWHEYRRVTQDCYHNKHKKITIITGHGIMSTEFLHWVSSDPYAIRCERQNPNTGSWTVYIKKNISVQVQAPATDLSGLYKKFNRK